MQIELLDTFLDLVETRSFHRTAERLEVTQSTVSARVQVLEAAIGARLFSRSRAGTELTTEGLKFQPHARGLRHAWTEAQRSVAPSGNAAVALRIGIQHDLAAGRIGGWFAAFRKTLPDCAFYIEPDYSIQMCQDVAKGALDFAILYSPQPQPDLHFASVGEATYQLVSSTGTTRASLKPESYIRASYAPAFDAAHAQSLPEMSATPFASGQEAAVAALLQAMGGAGFVLERTAAALIESGKFAAVTDIAPITQPVYVVMHQRHRPQRLHRRLTKTVLKHFGAR
jgi:LysR family transcriptional regulator, flagellar master operon regulator